MNEREVRRYPAEFSTSPHEREVEDRLRDNEEDIRRYVESGIENTSAEARGRAFAITKSFRERPTFWTVALIAAVAGGWILARSLSSED